MFWGGEGGLSVHTTRSVREYIVEVLDKTLRVCSPSYNTLKEQLIWVSGLQLKKTRTYIKVYKTMLILR